MPSPPIIIIGAGIGGLSAAVRLAVQGHQVVIYEQHEQVGGKMGEVAAGGFRWDTGPSVITMRPVLEALFATAGRRLDDYLTLQPVEPLTRYFYRDGMVLDATRDLPRMLAQIESFAPQDVEGYLNFLAYAARIHRITGPVFIYDRPPTLGSFGRVPFADWFRIDGLRTMNRAIERFVRSPHLRQMLGRFATYVGASPYLAPATLNVIAHVELNGGVWYPAGGVYAIARALEKLARELGVEIVLGMKVERVEVGKRGTKKGQRATGIGQRAAGSGRRASGGKELDLAREGWDQGGRGAGGWRCRGVWVDEAFREAAAVIANVDVSTVYEKLLPEYRQIVKKKGRLQRLEPSCSGFILLLGVEGTHPQLAHHNIFFAPDYPAEFEAIFGRGVMPAEPTIYVSITAKSDPDHAPPGCENWFVLVNAPPLGPAWDWEKEADRVERRILELLARQGIDIREKIRVRRRLTPADLERLTGAQRGALYGSSSNSRWAAFQRPSNRSKEVPGLYFCGGTTHPGGGVPMVMLSGKVAVEMLLADFRKSG